MSHNILYEDYSLNVNRKKVQRDWDIFVQHEDWGEGATGLPNSIIWKENRIFDTYEDAKAYIEAEDAKRWYNCMAVQYRVTPRNLTSKALDALVARLQKERDKLAEYTKAHSVKLFKADFVGCAGCGSKLNRLKLLGECCPLCRTDLRGKTTLDTIAKYNANIKELEKKIKDEEKALALKSAKNAEVRWLCKVEYHT